LLGRRRARVAFDDRGVDCRGIAGAEQQVDGLSDELGARAPGSSRALVEGGEARIVELGQGLTPSDAISRNMAARERPSNRRIPA
jgi:hypothetical protein